MRTSQMIYLDNNATTKPLDEVVDAMMPFLRDRYANSSSLHPFGQEVRHEVERARRRVAGLIGANTSEIVFTSSGTESINLAMRSALAAQPGKRRMVMSTVEHSAVLQLGDQLEREGIAIERIGVDGEGRIDVDLLESAMTPDTALVTLIWANNETGVRQDVRRITETAARAGVWLHLDAVQAAGKLPIDLAELPATMLSISAHKFHGPKGAATLFIRRGTPVSPLVIGGGQERGRRGGTENVAGIVGMGVAAAAALECPASERQRIADLRDRLERGIREDIPHARVHGAGTDRICNTTNVGIPGIQAEALLLMLGEADICVSSGAACSSGSIETSHVLRAMGVDSASAEGAIRFSLSRFTTREEIDEVIRTLPRIVRKLESIAGR